MRKVLAAVFQHTKVYDKLPLFEFMRDEQRTPYERLSFYPCMAHFIMSFGDLNKYVLRQEPTQDPYQELVNAHTYEDDHHWPWYLEDFTKLGLDKHRSNAEDLRFLWGDEAAVNRVLMYRLSAMILNATSVQRLAIIEAIEQTGNVLFNHTLKLAKRISAETGVELRYLGEHHHKRESGHMMGSDHKVMASIELTEAQREELIAQVQHVFAWFSEWTEELLAYAKANPLNPEDVQRRDPTELESVLYS